jgi:hypothetical protein
MWMLAWAVACPKAASPTGLTCVGPTDPEGAAWFAAVQDGDPLLAFGVATFGPVRSCDVRYDQTEDGILATAVFALGRATYTVQNLPPESTIRELRSPVGFPDEAAATAALRASAAAAWSTVPLDWDHPALEAGEGGEEARVVWAADEGLNLSFRELHHRGRLVAIRASWAL